MNSCQRFDMENERSPAPKDVYDQQQMGASYHLLGLLYQYAKTCPVKLLQR